MTPAAFFALICSSSNDPDAGFNPGSQGGSSVLLSVSLLRVSGIVITATGRDGTSRHPTSDLLEATRIGKINTASAVENVTALRVN